MRTKVWILIGLAALIAVPAIAGPLPIKLTEVSGCKADAETLCDLLYPIGFSKRGKFAYLRAPADEAVGAYLWEFKIVDLVTDKPVASIDWQQAGPGEADDSIQDLKSLLKKKRRDFETLLGRHRIRPVANPRLHAFPIPVGKGTVDARLDDEEQTGADDPSGFRNVIHHVVLTDGAGRSKEIGRLTSASGDMGPLTFPPRILGWIKSPFEPRAVVVLEQSRRGYEGPPHVSSFVLMGAHLKAGFKHRGK